MLCPQCRKEVPTKFLWIASGANGSLCPHCNVSLCPKAMCAVVLFLLSCVLGDATLVVLRHYGVEFWTAFLAFFGVFALVYALGLRLILRLRVKGAADAELHPPRTATSAH